MTDVVRVAAGADAERVGRLLHDFRAEFDTPSEGALHLGHRMRGLLDRDDVLVLLSGPPDRETGLGVVILRATCLVDGDAALLEELYVVPARRNEGIGGRLLRLAIDEVRARGAETFEVPVDEGDTDARRFYERHGFTNFSSPEADERMLYYERPLQPVR